MDTQTLSESALEKGENRPVAHWSAVFAMTLCVFALIASEFMPVSLLTPIASDLNVSEGWTGYGIAISGAFAVLTSLTIASLAGSMNRKTLMLLMTLLMSISCLIVGSATNYVVYMIGRALIGVVIGGFWSMSVAVAMRLVPTESVPKALAIFNSGNALATVIAAPLGSYLGSIIGWRGAFFCLVPVALLVLIWQWISLPSMEAEPSEGKSNNALALLRRPLVAFGMLAAGLFFMGQFSLFTYIRPFLETVTKVDIPVLSSMLLALGVSGFVGTLFINGFIRKGLYPTLIIIPVLLALLVVGLLLFPTWIVAVFVLLALWGCISTSAPVVWWAWLAQSMPKNAEAGGGLMVAVIQLSIALGSTVGGMLFDGKGYQATFIASMLMFLLASFVTCITARVSNVENGH